VAAEKVQSFEKNIWKQLRKFIKT